MARDASESLVADVGWQHWLLSPPVGKGGGHRKWEGTGIGGAARDLGICGDADWPDCWEVGSPGARWGGGASELGRRDRKLPLMRRCRR